MSIGWFVRKLGIKVQSEKVIPWEIFEDWLLDHCDDYIARPGGFRTRDMIKNLKLYLKDYEET